MYRIPKSGLNNTNNFGRIALLSYEEVLGKPGLNAILNLAGISYLIDNYPPANMDRAFDFADYTSILVAMEEIYGPRGGRGLRPLRSWRAFRSPRSRPRISPSKLRRGSMLPEDWAMRTLRSLLSLRTFPAKPKGPPCSSTG